MGGGGGGFIPSSSEALQSKIEAAREEERKKLDSSVNELLRGYLCQYNDRDTELTQDRLESLAGTIGDDINIESIMFGGSVAKHTYVDGLSDIDALVVLDRSNTQGLSSQEVISDLCEILKVQLSQKDIDSIETGKLAVTINYSDGTELQLLPAVRVDGSVKVPSADGVGWNQTNPEKFQQELTQENKKLNGALIPSIKLVKSLVSDLPKQQQLSGYHIEALAIDAASSHKGDMTPKTLISHILDHASARVRKPIRDLTGQSNNVDDYLGDANSTQRKIASQALSGINRRLNAATSLAQWKAMFGGE